MMDAERLDALEIRIAHQDREIEDLNQVIAAQWREIERMRREISRLTDQYAEVEALARDGRRPEPPPPHY